MRDAFPRPTTRPNTPSTPAWQMRATSEVSLQRLEARAHRAGRNRWLPPRTRARPDRHDQVQKRPWLGRSFDRRQRTRPAYLRDQTRRGRRASWHPPSSRHAVSGPSASAGRPGRDASAAQRVSPSPCQVAHVEAEEVSRLSVAQASRLFGSDWLASPTRRRVTTETGTDELLPVAARQGARQPLQLSLPTAAKLTR